MDDIDALKAAIQRLEEEHDRLVEALRHHYAHGTKISIEEFIATLCAFRGRTWGWKHDYAEASQGTKHPVTTEQIDAWRRKNEVPDWAFEQITILSYRKRR